MRGRSAAGKTLYQQFILLIIAALAATSVIAMQSANLPDRSPDISTAKPPVETALATPVPTLLSDPFLQLPTAASVQVVWFTEFAGTNHTVEYGEKLTASATTTLLSRTREDSDSRVPGRTYTELTRRKIWRHQATITGLNPGDRLPYRVISRDTNGQTVTSDVFTLAATPPTGQPLQILLTSDHQLKPLTPANLQKVEETVGRVDAVFFAGDLVDHADRASEWFDDAKGMAFFPSLQGRAQHALTHGDITTPYTGGALIQHAPIFSAIGNHEVMGRYSDTEPINAQFANTLPRQIAAQLYPAADGANAERWIKDHTFNTDTYEEIFSLPTTQLPDGRETKAYYAVSFGDVRLVSLYVTQVWRSPALTPNTKGRYREQHAIADPKAWGYGQHIFEDIRSGSVQYKWLEQELASEAFQSAKYKIVMLHHPPHTLGGNIVPAFTDPVPVENRAADGTLQSIQYEYPKADDYLIRDLEPLLANANVQLVFYGHSHLWNRFVSPGGMHFLETSNVGNTYGAHLVDSPRDIPTEVTVKTAGDLQNFSETYAATGDPNGLTPVVPTIDPLTDDSGSALPYLASNAITSFTIFDTGTGTLSSYYFDTRAPSSAVVKFDEFGLSL